MTIISLTTTTASSSQALAGGQPGPQGPAGAPGIASPITLGINSQTGNSYTFQATDVAKTVLFTASGAIAGTLPQLTPGWWIIAKVTGTGTLTITPSGATIDGVATKLIPTGQSSIIWFDGNNYQSTGPIAFIGDTGTAGIAGFVGAVPPPPAGAANRNYALSANASWLPLLARGYLSGGGLANDGTTPNTIIDIAAGVAFSDDFDTMLSFGAITKSISSTWAVGNGNGGLDTGSVANNTWYHVYAITRLDTGVDDALISTSATSPTMPTNYTKKRRLGSIKTDSSAHILAFFQLGDEFLWKVPLVDANNVTVPNNTETSLTLTVPTGLKVWALLNVKVSFNTVGDTFAIYPIDIGSQLGASWLSGGATTSTFRVFSASNSPETVWFKLRTNTSAQVKTWGAAGDALYTAATMGWIDRRGQDG